MDNTRSLASAAGRVLIALIFVWSGFGKITGYAGAAGYMESVGVPSILLPLVILLELAGGVAIIVGFQTRLAAAALAVYTLLAAVLFHTNFADQMQMINFMKNVAIAGGFLFLVAFGPGGYAVDNRQG